MFFVYYIYLIFFLFIRFRLCQSELEDVGVGLHERKEEISKEVLLDDEPAAGMVLPKGCFVVYVADEMRRFVIPLSYLRLSTFRS
ncbi:unnamed protein product [Musa acuminata subsp. malaccensis]|uniref:(wild Malaysian banana) hypothetical protein n=1 Tax=Musa acuminata subsp. malaccensis TaxID=214687 RepID=A0A804JW62_MUSAM|nr:unnamed protein product [Musa acuminata subsp. malaccensis]